MTQYLAFNKKLLKSWGPSGFVSYMTYQGKMWLSLDERTKAPELGKILDRLLCLDFGSPYSFDFDDETFGVVD